MVLGGLFCLYFIFSKEKQPIDILRQTNYENTTEFYRLMRDLAYKDASNGNLAAISIYRQALYGLGRSLELKKGIQSSSAKSLDESITQPWVDLIKLKAKKKDLFYMNVLGVMIKFGYLFPKDRDKGDELWAQAAEKGCPMACLKMGNILKGILDPQVKAQRIKWYTLASQEGNRIAAYNLGCIYYHGKDNTAIDYPKAVRYYTDAAKAGHAEAMRNLAICYLYAKGVDLDRQESFKWFYQSLKVGNEKSREFLEQYFPTEYWETGHI
ncbi:MAG: sel1 repeat family protein [Planctomycetes bacterium]|nr:sel1 repeat family protein [Planctomycetota bacterium]